MTANEVAAPKDRVLDDLIAHLSEHGLGNTSLRGLAAGVGTSHRMLSYHFGSRHNLLIEVSQRVELRQREAFIALVADSEAPVSELMWAMYRRLADPALRSHERLFFELYVQALQDGEEGQRYLPDVVEAWIPPLATLFTRMGLDDQHAMVEARLALAVARGLLLDLLATEDTAAVDAAMRRYVSRYVPAT
ncbi:TetR/AcrR family transcriptional regulator [Aeromicrobium sp.]|uniref:TetR/AcrR family transcriptional regulator n=1 Tax=Aeromicrobium sp. TaxID=1871063 RepID=UPI0030BF7096